MFVVNGFLATQKHIRPFVPADIRESYTAGGDLKMFDCDVSGGFYPDSSNRQDPSRGRCREWISDSTKTSWLFRLTKCRGITGVWKQEGASWKPWVAFSRASEGCPQGDGVANDAISPEARQYAASRGMDSQIAGPTSSSAPIAKGGNVPPTVDPAAELRKALGKLFKQ
jgi:hypothetical protein